MKINQTHQKDALVPSMKNKRKIFSDPIYGPINFKFPLVLEIIDHPYFQRLRRIAQMGLTKYVYPGATHSRFSHALGAAFLAIKTVGVLREKSIKISHEEEEGLVIAILLHDIGHGPFSHALESKILNKPHEEISLDIIELLNVEFDQRLSLAIDIFRGEHKRKFLSELVSSQLDLDRMDYLTRDSYYSGVAEGIIGHDRIIHSFNVVNDLLCIDEKAVYSVEKFLMARKFMYYQVYLHRVSICAEKMLEQFFLLFKEESNLETIHIPDHLNNLLFEECNKEDNLDMFLKLDDYDIVLLMKQLKGNKQVSYELEYLASSLIDRRLMECKIKDIVQNSDLEYEYRLNNSLGNNPKSSISDKLLLSGTLNVKTYDTSLGEIRIKTQNKELKLLSDYFEIDNSFNTINRIYNCFPRNIN